MDDLLYHSNLLFCCVYDEKQIFSQYAVPTNVTVTDGSGFSYLEFTMINIPSFFSFSYVMTVAALVFYSLHFDNRAKEVWGKFYFISFFLGFLMLASFGVMIYYIIVEVVTGTEPNAGFTFKNVIMNPTILKYLIIGNLSVNYFMPLIFNFKKVGSMAWAFLHYIYYGPTYIHVLIIYAFCRIDDLSWGTKGLADKSGSVL